MGAGGSRWGSFKAAMPKLQPRLIKTASLGAGRKANPFPAAQRPVRLTRLTHREPPLHTGGTAGIVLRTRGHRRHARLHTCASGVSESRAPASRAFEGRDAGSHGHLRSTHGAARLRPHSPDEAAAGTRAPPPPQARTGGGIQASDKRGLLPRPPSAHTPPSRSVIRLSAFSPVRLHRSDAGHQALTLCPPRPAQGRRTANHGPSINICWPNELAIVRGPRGGHCDLSFLTNTFIPTQEKEALCPEVF